MPYCPRCRYEYREGITACADCQVALATELPRADREIELVSLYTGRSMVARMLQETLTQRGIPSLLRAAEPLRGLIGDVALPMFEEVLVSSADLEARREEVEECLDFVRQGRDLPEEFGEEHEGHEEGTKDTK